MHERSLPEQQLVLVRLYCRAGTKHALELLDKFVVHTVCVCVCVCG